MPLEIGKQAINFFFERSKARDSDNKPAITFYGGEPLLGFDFIRGIVEYTKEKGRFDDYNFSLTTNAILLSDEIIEYFVKNDISILVSIDGPREMHNRYRISKKETGSFDEIIEKLLWIKKSNINYFMNKISFNAVLAPPYNFASLIDFFYQNKMLKPIREKLRISAVDSYETSFLEDLCLTGYQENFYDEVEKLKRNFKISLIKGTFDELTIEKRFFLEDFYNIANRNMELLDDKYPPGGTCIPGQRRLFVNTNGKFFMCEKVGDNFTIGNVDEGFNFMKIASFYKKFDEFFRECKHCWALRLCKKCFNNIRKGEVFDKQRKEEFCKKTLKKLEANLVTYCEIVEENPEAFQAFEKVIII